MKIAVIGSGNVGGTLGSSWAKFGHEVTFGVRSSDSEKVQNLLKSIGQNARATSVNEAAESSEVVVFTTPWAATESAIKAAGDLTNKIIIDCTNPIVEGLKLGVAWQSSGAEKVAEWANSTRVVKAFNTTGYENMAEPIYGEQAMTMFVCSDDIEARKIVVELAENLGCDVCETGPLYHARYLEPMALLWIDMAIVQKKGRNFAFKVLKREKD